jgi:hypothetical protein
VALDRLAEFGVVDDADGEVGLSIYSPVEKGTREPLVDVTNRYENQLQVTVSLATCSDGTLHDPDNDSGCSVTFTLAAGGTDTVDIEAAISNTTVQFDVTATAPGFRFEATRSTETQGTVKGAVDIRKFDLGNNAVDTTRDQFSVKKLDIRDNDADADLTRRALSVTDGAGNSVGLTDTASTADPDRTFAKTDRWTEKKLTLQATDDLTAGTTYHVELTGYDADGNTDARTKSVTA